MLMRVVQVPLAQLAMDIILPAIHGPALLVQEVQQAELEEARQIPAEMALTVRAQTREVAAALLSQATKTAAMAGNRQVAVEVVEAALPLEETAEMGR